jgi:hypothetical protein
MKKLLASGICLFLASSAVLMPQAIQGCEIYDHATDRIHDLSCLIHMYDEMIIYDETSRDFTMGYLKGQRAAFFDVRKVIDDKQKN